MANISLFRKVTDNVPCELVDHETVLSWIQNNYDNVAYTQDFLRREPDKKKRTKLKKSLPAVTWSGSFFHRNKEEIQFYSQIICIDIDNLEIPEVVGLKEEFKEDPYTYAAFISPSATGLKVLYNCYSTPEEHETIFDALVRYVEDRYRVDVDKSGRDICRLCFLSHDHDIYINKYSQPFGFQVLVDAESKKSEPKIQPVSKIPKQTIGMDYLDKCHEITSKTYKSIPGQFNNYIVTFSIFANRYGIDENTVILHLQNHCHEHDAKETKASVISTYKKFKNESGAWLTNSKPGSKPPKGEKKPEVKNNSDVDERVKFWYEVENERTGKIEYKFAYDDAIEFLQNNGFYRFPLGNDFYQFIHVKESIRQVEVIQPIKIKDFFLKYLLSKKDAEFKAVREMFRRGAKNYCSINLLEGLDYYKPTFKKDTKDTAFVYFRNCYLEIKAESIAEKKYSTLDNFIWSKQVIDFDYTRTEYQDSDFAKFVTLCIIGAKKDLKEYNEIEIQKIESFSTTIGYLLHRCKNPALTKAVVAVDKRLRSTGENNGRTGKSLLSKAIAKMLNVCLIDGKNFKFDSPFPFQMANIDTQLINFNDVLKNFDFERLFGMITEEFTFEKKGKDSITLPFEDAPKFYISTNTTLKGSGESNKGRQQIIEFDNYFNTDHTPAKEFGRMFFYDWDQSEYAKFYTYMIDCVKYYLENGLIDFPLENYEINKLIDTAGEEFVDYMNEVVLDQLEHKKEFDLHAMYEAFISQNKNREKTQIKTFNKNVKAWADINGLAINAHLNGARDKRNNITYLTFSHKL